MMDPDCAGAAIVDTATDLVAESGLDGFSVDELARRARVSKATIYRRWRSRGELVRAVCQQVHPEREHVDTGSVRDDVEAIVVGLAESLAKPSRAAIVVAVADAAERDTELARLQRDVSRRRRTALVDALRRGVERGELDAGTDLECLADLLAGAVFYRRFFRRSGTTAAEARAVVDAVLGPRLATG